jgi:hypothetical protein
VAGGVDASKSESDLAHLVGTPAIVCSSCRAETPLLAIDVRRNPAPVCPECDTPFPGFGRSGRQVERVGVDPVESVVALIESLAAGSLETAAERLGPDVTWTDPDVVSATIGREAVRELWRDRPSARSVWQLAARPPGVHALILEREVQPETDRLVTWVLDVGDDGMVRSCTVSVLGRGPALGGRRLGA